MGMGVSRGRGHRLPQVPGPGRNTARYMVISNTVCYIASLTQQAVTGRLHVQRAKYARQLQQLQRGVAHVTISSCHPTTAKWTRWHPSVLRNAGYICYPCLYIHMHSHAEHAWGDKFKGQPHSQAGNKNIYT